jgi:hypothetical protein
MSVGACIIIRNISEETRDSLTDRNVEFRKKERIEKERIEKERKKEKG